MKLNGDLKNVSLDLLGNLNYSIVALLTFVRVQSTRLQTTMLCYIRAFVDHKVFAEPFFMVISLVYILIPILLYNDMDIINYRYFDNLLCILLMTNAHLNY